MNKKKIALVILVLLGILSNVLIIKVWDKNVPAKIRLTETINADEAQILQIYYGKEPVWSEEQSAVYSYDEAGVEDNGYFLIPSDVRYLRFDFGKTTGNVRMHDILLEVDGHKKKVDLSLFETLKAEELKSLSGLRVEEGTVLVTMDGDDPYVVIDLGEGELAKFAQESVNQDTRLYRPIMCAAIDLMLLFFCMFYEKLFSLPKELYQNRKLIGKLAKNDFKTRYAGSYLGIFWAFVQPIVTVVVYWFVFQVGFRSGTTQDCPFVLWLVTGLVPWFFFQEALIGATNSMMEYSYLVKKVVFKISVLPIVKIFSAIFVHLFFIAFTVVLFICYGYLPGIHAIQIVYYLLCMIVFVLALSYMTCAVVVFFKDLSQIINIVLQVGVWMTPIMWDYTMLTNPYPAAMWILKANPMFYIVQGYRNSLIHQTWFWQDLGWTIYFWVVTGILFVIGSKVFKRLKPHFSDVL